MEFLWRRINCNMNYTLKGDIKPLSTFDKISESWLCFIKDSICLFSPFFCLHDPFVHLAHTCVFMCPLHMTRAMTDITHSISASNCPTNLPNWDLSGSLNTYIHIQINDEVGFALFCKEMLPPCGGSISLHFTLKAEIIQKVAGTLQKILYSK